jgi:hypothetical protein
MEALMARYMTEDEWVCVQERSCGGSGGSSSRRKKVV